MPADQGEGAAAVRTDNGITSSADTVSGTSGAGATSTARVDKSTKSVRSPRRGRVARTETRQRSEPELLAEIGSKLDRLVAVMAAQGKDRDTQVAILAAAGCDSRFIGLMLGISPGAVRNRPGWRRAQESGGYDSSEEPA